VTTWHHLQDHAALLIRGDIQNLSVNADKKDKRKDRAYRGKHKYKQNRQ